MYWLRDGKLHEFARLPSSGDKLLPRVRRTLTHAGRSSRGIRRTRARPRSTPLSSLSPSDSSAWTDDQLRAIARADSILSHQRSNGGFAKSQRYDDPPPHANSLSPTGSRATTSIPPWTTGRLTGKFASWRKPTRARISNASDMGASPGLNFCWKPSIRTAVGPSASLSGVAIPIISRLMMDP